MSCLLYLKILDNKEFVIYYKKRNYYYICMRYFLVYPLSEKDYVYIDNLAKEIREKKNVKMIKTIKSCSFSLWNNNGEHIYVVSTNNQLSYMIIGASLIGLLLTPKKQRMFIKELSYKDE